MSLLDEVMASVTAMNPREVISRVEVSQRHWDQLVGIARQETLTVPHTGGDMIFGIPVVVVEADLERPVIVYADGRRG